MIVVGETSVEAQYCLTGKIMNYSKGKFKFYIFCGLLLSLIGIAAILQPIVLPDIIPVPISSSTMLWGGLAVAFLGILFLLAAVGQIYQANLAAKEKRSKSTSNDKSHASSKKSSKNKKKSSKGKSTGNSKQWQGQQVVPKYDARRQPELVNIADGNMQYYPSASAQKVINMGSKQPVEEKFSEIAKMEKAQFVVYVAKLFSIKGYVVKYTPVIDNFNIDLIVEKTGVAIAIGCLLTNKVLSENDIRAVADGRRHYQAKNVIALTNMYFDRAAFDYAKQQNILLVDHDILEKDYM